MPRCARRDALTGGCPHVRHVEILSAIVVVVQPANAHAGAHVFHARLCSHIGKRAVAVVAVQILPPEVVHDVEIGPAVTVVVAPTTAKAVTGVVLVETRFGGHVTERSVAVVAHQEVRRTVVGVEIRQGIFVLIGALIVDVQTEVDIEVAIAIVVGDRRSGEGSLRRLREMKCVRLLAKLSLPFVHVKHRAVGADDDQVLVATVAEIRKQRAGSVLEDAEPGDVRDVLESSIPAIAIEAVRQTSRLADVDVIEAVAINVSHCDSVVPVDVDAAGLIKNGAPVVGPMQHLRRVGWVPSKGLRRDIHENRRGGAALCLINRTPGADAKGGSGGFTRFPLQIPFSDTLFPVKTLSRPHELVAHSSLHARGLV